ncbi:hypothetical protein Ae505Ps2_6287 [Pseudonocardia sp. Ae505_Ps2]|nr:hypothetical protein Ae505Ps2_6287 [Pseudonocardia sp. Ae505_Ps2]
MIGKSGQRMVLPVAKVIFAAGMAMFLLLSVSSAAMAQDSGEVDRVEVGSPDGLAHLVLEFDRPLLQSEAEKIRSRFTSVTSFEAQDYQRVETLGCHRGFDRSDRNGVLSLQFTCLPSHGVVAWGYRLSPAVKSTVVGPVTERGLQWWQNGAKRPSNSSHVESADYIFHGSMNPVLVNDVLDYQDLFTYRHNLGGGGTAKLVFAGSLRLTY